MDKPLSPIEQLDKTLEWFAMEPNGPTFQDVPREFAKRDEILQSICKTFPYLNNPEFITNFDLILRRLVEDGNIHKQTDNAYTVTFDGKIAAQQGGYRQKLTNENAENIRVAALEHFQKANAGRMTCLTIVIAVGTAISAVYYCVELYWKYHWFH